MMVHMYDANTSYLDNLMPWSENLPDVCKKAPWQNTGSLSGGCRYSCQGTSYLSVRTLWNVPL